MARTLRNIRNVAGGLALAAVIGFASDRVLAFGCEENTVCESGALQGNEIGCGCGGPGNCDVVQGLEVVCVCYGFGYTVCDCDNGCQSYPEG